MMLTDLNAWLKDNTAVSVVGAVLVLFVRPFIERAIKGRNVWAAMQGECGDLIRHLRANSARIEEMKEIMRDKARVPQRNHIAKLAVMDHLMLFNDSALDHLSGRKIAIVHRARVRLRNLNLDVDEALRQHDASEYEQLAVMLEYFTRLHERLTAWVPGLLREQDHAPAGLSIVSQPWQAQPHNTE